MPTILVVDDEPGICRAFEQAFGKEHRVVSVASAEAALARLEELRPDLLILDLGLPRMGGLDLLPRLKGIPVIVITAQGTMATAVEAVKRGAWEYVLKPVDLDVMQIHVDRALERVRLSEEVARLKTEGGTGLVGNSAAMQEVYKRIGAAARAPVSVLLTGESGTGKELAARAIHAHSDRAAGPFVAVNCAALPEALLQSELFGHERGAFTGAVARRQGRFEAADGGTLFLDEVGEMSPAVQASLLRVLETQSFERVGGSESVKVDVRLVAATNRDLARMIGDGRFREDLYYRLHVVEIGMPPLRDRPEDLPLLAAHFLKPSGKALSREALEALRHRPWPGNVRQLRNALEHAAALAPGVILPEHLPQASAAAPAGGFGAWLEERISEAPPEALYESVLELVERPLLERVMRLEKGNQVQAARRLGIHRTTLRSKLQKYGMLGSEA